MFESGSGAGIIQDKSGNDYCARKKKDKQHCSVLSKRHRRMFHIFQNKMFENKDTVAC